MTGSTYRKGILCIVLAMLSCIAGASPYFRAHSDVPANLSAAMSARMAQPTAVTPPWDAIASYPSDPLSDISWSAGTSGVAGIQAAFNNARTIENSQLGTALPLLTLPSQDEWDGMTDGEKALWLMNRERIDRNVMPLHGLETNVMDVAQTYADYLLDNDAWGHYEDGRSPWQRLHDNPAIGACHDTLSVSENIAVFVTSGSSISLPLERSIFMWIYDDGSCCSWGHRHAILWYPYNDNSGAVGREGFLGIGRANGGPYQGPFSQPWNYAEMIVMNVFDPCAAWIYDAPAAPEITGIAPDSSMLGETVFITNLAGHNFTPGATVTLTRTGHTDIDAAHVSVVNASQITCHIDLRAAVTGQWNVVVTNPDGASDTDFNGFTVTPPVPTFTSIPAQLLLVNETRENALNLRDYAEDPYYDPSELMFSITNSPDANAGISLDSSDFIDIVPAPGWHGQTEVVVQVVNPAAQTDTATFMVIVTDVLYNVDLPLVFQSVP